MSWNWRKLMFSKRETDEIDAAIQAAKDALIAAAPVTSALPSVLPTTPGSGWTSFRFKYTTLPASPRITTSMAARNIQPGHFDQELPKSKSTEPVIGYRVWNLDKATATLRSVFQSSYTWPHRVALRKDPINNSGIYAVKDVQTLTNGLWNVWQYPGVTEGLYEEYNAAVAGSVYLWGEVTEHTSGYRAEFAYPKELFMPTDTDPLLVMTIEHNYGVPVSLREEFKSAAQERKEKELPIAVVN